MKNQWGGFKKVSGHSINWGISINTIISFIIIAFAVFLVIKGINRIKREKEAPPAEVTNKECPFCFSTIPIQSCRCPHCTSQLNAKEKNMRFGKRQMEDNIFDIANFDQEIYRIFSIDRFKELIIKKELVLLSPWKWDDPFENFFLKANAIDEEGNHISLQRIAESWFGQCWTFSSESDAMWRIYSPAKNGVRVSTTVRKLFSCLWDDTDAFAGLKYFIGRVCYKSRKDIEEIMEKQSFWNIAIGGQNDGFAKLLSMKRLEFSHENEVRILVNDTDETKRDKGCYRIMFDYQSVLKDVCLDPRLDDKEYQEAKSDIQGLGCLLPITQSELYKVNFSPIRLH